MSPEAGSAQLGVPHTDLEPKRPDATLGELVSEMTTEVSTLLRKEVQLAKVEAKEEAGRAARAGGMFAGGAVAAVLALMLVSFAVAWWLDEVMDRGLAFVLVAVVWGIVAAVLVTVGRKQLRAVQPLPQTMDTLKEDVAWAKQHKS